MYSCSLQQVRSFVRSVDDGITQFASCADSNAGMDRRERGILRAFIECTGTYNQNLTVLTAFSTSDINLKVSLWGDLEIFTEAINMPQN